MKKFKREINNAVLLLKDSKGAGLTSEHLMWMLGILVIIVLVLGFLLFFFDRTLLPELGKRIMDILGMKP